VRGSAGGRRLAAAARRASGEVDRPKSGVIMKPSLSVALLCLGCLVVGWWLGCKNGMDGCDEEPEPSRPTHSETHHDDTVRDIYKIGVQKNGF
jgi:hypothetical protein